MFTRVKLQVVVDRSCDLRSGEDVVLGIVIVEESCCEW